MERGLMQFKSFKDFFPFYMGKHTNLMCRKLHFIGTCGVIALLILFFFTGNLFILGLIPFVGYGLAWTGHFLFEKNSPAAFKYPIYSLMGDFKMFWEILIGKTSAF
jgi:hypothetical protein